MWASVLSSNKNNCAVCAAFQLLGGRGETVYLALPQGVSGSLGRVGRRRKTSLFTENTFLRLNVPAPELGILL